MKVDIEMITAGEMNVGDKTLFDGVGNGVLTVTQIERVGPLQNAKDMLELHLDVGRYVVLAKSELVLKLVPRVEEKVERKV